MISGGNPHPPPAAPLGEPVQTTRHQRHRLLDARLHGAQGGVRRRHSGGGLSGQSAGQGTSEEVWKDASAGMRIGLFTGKSLPKRRDPSSGPSGAFGVKPSRSFAKPT